MQRNECKPGTEVIIRGTIKEDDGTDFNSIKITIRRDDGKTEDGFFDPSALEPAQAKYDPARKYRKGDLVRITGFHGRLFGCGGERKLSKGNKIGTQIALHEDETPGGDVSLPDGFLLNRNNYLSVACIELVKPVEEIEKEDTKTTAPEEGCCNPVTEPASTLEMIKEAYDRLEELVVRCITPVLLCMLTGEKGGKIEHRNSTNNSVSKMTGKEGIGWNAARGFLYASATCFSGAPEAISQGIKYIFEFLERKKQKSVFSAIIDTPFDH